MSAAFQSEGFLSGLLQGRSAHDKFLPCKLFQSVHF